VRCFRSAIDIARKQQARSWEFRAATSLARLARGTEREGEARTILMAAYGWFTEGFDTRDLKDARGLLNELSDKRPGRVGRACWRQGGSKKSERSLLASRGSQHRHSLAGE
jgi:hypothetical protein